MSSNDKKHVVDGLEYGFLIFGLGIIVFSIIYTLKDPLGLLFFVKPGGSRLSGIPGIFILIAGLGMAYFPFKKIFLSKNK